ncbi:MAG: family 20 glycosylhydrolase [Flavobacteriales bacterium]|nr:family 20 glycosylhydrolase [Flavobacteriales bacterium]
MRLLAAFALLPTLLLAQPASVPDLIPRPVSVSMDKGRFPIDSRLGIVVSERSLKQEASFLREALTPLLPEPPMVMPNMSMEGHVIALLLNMDADLPPSGYSLVVTPERIELEAADGAGIFHGVQTLIQLLPQGGTEAGIPCMRITDHPRFSWRGMHLDECRHFFGIDFVKKYIDLMARYKMNSFHWHLTEDQGWRIQIKKYPQLTALGAWRRGSQIGPYAAQTFDTLRYGGFYTQDQIREVVAYAAARHITIVPEIEMPGHAMAALASYPHLGCTGGPYEVQRGWGVFDEVFCAGNDSVFTFLEDVLTEVMDLFPGPFIHIGGDECPKTRWKTCPECQSRMQTEGLKDEHELQSYFIRRMERFVNSKGRKIIGWDEILEGGLAPNAAVMSWRGTEGGIAAAKAGHYAVMSPGSHCYFDHYQGDPANEPVAFGGYTTLQKVYSYEPVPAELKPKEQQYILGAQGNVWTEYILSPEHVEYMAVPRMLALAEVLWTPKEQRDEADFMRRLEGEFPRLEQLGVNASKSVYQVRITPKQGNEAGTIALEFSGSREDLPIHFDLTKEVTDQDNHDPATIYSVQYSDRVNGPIIIDHNAFVSAWAAIDDTPPSLISMPSSRRNFHFNLATARPITLSTPPHERFSTGGAFTLVDGIRGSSRRVDNEWLAWKGDVTITVDLGEAKEITHMGIGALGDTHSWIHLPKEVEFSTSLDGKTYQETGVARPSAGASGKVELTISQQTKARYVRLTVRSAGAIPEGLPGAGNPAWLFLDEVEVR